MATEECLDRFIRTRIDLTYYDTTYFGNSLQNMIDHYTEIPYVDEYKSFNSLMKDAIIVENVNVLYFASKYPVNLTLKSSGELLLLTSEFYLYQPTQQFSFTIEDAGLSNCDPCTAYLQLFYATVIKDSSSLNSANELYNPGTGTTA